MIGPDYTQRVRAALEEHEQKPKRIVLRPGDRLDTLVMRPGEPLLLLHNPPVIEIVLPRDAGTDEIHEALRSLGELRGHEIVDIEYEEDQRFGWGFQGDCDRCGRALVLLPFESNYVVGGEGLTRCGAPLRGES